MAPLLRYKRRTAHLARLDEEYPGFLLKRPPRTNYVVTVTGSATIKLVGPLFVTTSKHDPQLFDGSQITFNVGMVLNNSGNIHNSFYQSMSSELTGYFADTPFDHTMGNAEGDYFLKGYWACIGCHSEVDVETEIVKAEYNHSDGIRRKYV